MGRKLILLAFVFCIASACQGDVFPSAADLAKPPYAAEAQVGRRYGGYVLHTHCGITHARIDGTYWEADPPLVDSGSPPAGWQNPVAEGTLTLESSARARFDADGRTAFFKRADGTPPPCN